MTSKSYEAIKIEKENGITWLFMNRPDKRNAMSPQLHIEMDEALDDLAVDPETEVLVLTGAGDAFCAGQDIKLYFRGGDADPKLRRKAGRASNNWPVRYGRRKSNSLPWPTCCCGCFPRRPCGCSSRNRCITSVRRTGTRCATCCVPSVRRK